MRRTHAMSYFHEHDGLALAHDQIELAVAGIEVAREQGKSGSLQSLAGALFEQGAGRAHQPWLGSLDAGGDCTGALSICKLPLSGWATPSWNFAQTSTRRTRPNWSAVSWPLAPGK